jgi:hypothetical protein
VNLAPASTARISDRESRSTRPEPFVVRSSVGS